MSNGSGSVTSGSGQTVDINAGEVCVRDQRFAVNLMWDYHYFFN